MAALSARTAAEGAYLNVAINLPGIQDKTFKSQTLDEANKVRDEVVKHTEQTVAMAERKVKETV